jgi:16S rRNA (adenine1518-N6/adenine1519-N6)-dimethyltransferase
MRAKKSLGQNFLMHQATANRIADAAALSKTDTVLEIGPGTGMLTRALLQRVGKMVAIEADGELIPILAETFAAELSSGALVLIHGDIRNADLSMLPEPYHLVANIPYYLTGELMRRFLSGAHKPSSMTLLVQKEVAERVARAKKESLLSLSVKIYGTPRYHFTVSKGSFVPKPKVDSAVLSVTGIKNPFTTPEEERRFFQVLHAGFMHKRKRLAGNLTALAPSDAVRTVMETLDIPAFLRAEDLPLATWIALARLLPH